MKELERVECTDPMPVRYFKLIMGLFLYAVGVVISINAGFGYSPWDAFHKSMSAILNIQIGTVSMIIGFIIILIGLTMGDRPGIGSISNMFFLGMFTNIVINLDFLPHFTNYYVRLLTLPVAILVIAYGSYLYLSAAMGIGPKDWLMIKIHEKTGKSIRFVRNSIETTVLILAVLLNGPIGIGTLIMSLGIGYGVQFVFKIHNFDTNKVKHRGWSDEVASLKLLLTSINKV